MKQKNTEIKLLFTKLIDSISSISDELKTIRKLIETKGNNLNNADNNTGINDSVQDNEPKKIYLDFEKYLLQEKMQEKNNI